MKKCIESYITKNYYKLQTIAKTITKNHNLSNDLLHECILQLYDKDDIILKEYSDDQIRYYIVSIMRINWYSKTSPFYYKVRREFLNYSDIKEVLDMESEQENFEKQIIFDILEVEYSELTWFHKSIMDLYLTLGSLKKVSKKTSIPLASVGRYVKESKKQIRDNILKKIS